MLQPLCAVVIAGAVATVAYGAECFNASASDETPQHIDIDWKQGKLQRLAPLIGTYRYEEALSDLDVASALQVLMPAGEFKAIGQNLEVRNPIDFVDGNLVLRGNRAHQGFTEGAAIWIKIYDGTTRVALIHNGQITLYAKDNQYRYIPWNVAVLRGPLDGKR